MIRLAPNRRVTPIGVDVGSKSIKLVQFSGDHERLVDAARWDWNVEDDERPVSRERSGQLAEAIRGARDGKRFRGREAVICLNERDLFVQNIRVPKLAGMELDRVVQQEAAGRIPFAVAEAEIRYLEAADVRQGESIMREVILLACHRPALEELIEAFHVAGLRPVAVDVEPAALLRSYAVQFRRDEDRNQRSMIVHVGYSRTAIVIAEGDEILFVKYVDCGGRLMDQAVAEHLQLPAEEASALRRHNGDRRADQQDPEIARTVSHALRPVHEQFVNELSLCIRYHSVTFRGNPLQRLVVGGGEAGASLVETLQKRFDLQCEAGNPLRSYAVPLPGGVAGQWDVAAGLALRELAGKEAAVVS